MCEKLPGAAVLVLTVGSFGLPSQPYLPGTVTALKAPVYGLGTPVKSCVHSPDAAGLAAWGGLGTPGMSTLLMFTSDFTKPIFEACVGNPVFGSVAPRILPWELRLMRLSRSVIKN